MKIVKLPDTLKARPCSEIAANFSAAQEIYDRLKEYSVSDDIMEKFFEVCEALGVGFLWDH